MKLTNIQVRTINALLWIPIMIAAIFYFTWQKHLVANIFLTVFGILGGYEMGQMMKTKEPTTDTFFYPIFGGFFPIIALIELYYPPVALYRVPLIALILLFIFAKQTFVVNEEELAQAIPRTASMILSLFYPGFLLAYFIPLANMPHANYVYAFFLLATMLNDGAAYYLGFAFGKKTNSQGYIMVSPKKSLIGFLGGLTAAVLTAVLFHQWIKPDIFNGRPLWYAIFMALVCGLATVTGDLFESTLKRSAGIKDSGRLMAGRGGVLDSFDSFAFTAPVFYYFLYFA